MSKSKNVVIEAEKIKFVHHEWSTKNGVPFIKEALIDMKINGGRHKIKVVVNNT